MLALKITGDCPESEFKKGNILIVDPDMNAKNGYYAVFKRKGTRKLIVGVVIEKIERI